MILINLNIISIFGSCLVFLPLLVCPVQGFALQLGYTSPRPIYAPKIVQEYGKELENSATSSEQVTNYFPPDYISSAENIEKIIGITVDHIAYYYQLYYQLLYEKPELVREFHVREEYETPFQFAMTSWENIEKGSDIFIEGLGTFDIMDVYEKEITYRHERWKKFLSRSEWDGLNKIGVSKEFVFRTGSVDWIAENQRWPIGFAPWWLLSVQELQICGYFNKVIYKEWTRGHTFKGLFSIFKRNYLDERCKVFKHLVKYYDYWNDENHIGSIDELKKMTSEPDLEIPSDDMHPRQLLNFLRKRERKKKLGSDVVYEYLNELPDGYDMKVLRSKYEISDAGIELHNCALSYADEVENMECILVLHVDTKNNNKPLACNKPVTAEVRSKYDKYLEGVIEEWIWKL